MLVKHSLYFFIVTVIASAALFNPYLCVAAQGETALTVDVQMNGAAINIANYTMEELQNMKQTKTNAKQVKT